MFFEKVKNWFFSLSGIFTTEVLTTALWIALTVIIGFSLMRLLAVLIERYIMRRSTPQRRMIARKVISYTGFVIVGMIILRELGVEVTALLGAAGIVGIAVGFASQTSVSNIVSGLFLISEKPFAVGDVIKVGGATGIIQSIDLLSIKIRTFDNLFIRIPNEKILTSEVTNITRFPIRRMDITFLVSYKEDLAHVQEVLADITHKNPLCLDEPEPLIMFTDFKEAGIEILVGVWFSQQDFLKLKNSIIQDIASRFAAEGIQFSSPRRSLSVDPDAPLTVRISDDGRPRAE